MFAFGDCGPPQPPKSKAWGPAIWSLLLSRPDESRDSNAHSSAHLEEPAQLRGCPRRPQKNDAATLSVLRDAKTHRTRGLWVLEPARLSFLRDVEDEKARTDDPGVQGVMRL